MRSRAASVRTTGPSPGTRPAAGRGRMRCWRRRWPVTRWCWVSWPACQPPNGSPTWSSPPPATCSVSRPTSGRCGRWSARAGRNSTAVIQARRTQTNEPARCACLLPALAQLTPPLALLEVGASAGLTLLPDRYSYDYPGHPLIAGTDPRAPVLRCRTRGPVPLPRQVPEVRWRAGLDLNPLDVASEADMSLAGVPAVAGRGRPRAAAGGGDHHRPAGPAAGAPRRSADRSARTGPAGATGRDAGGLPLRGAQLPQRSLAAASSRPRSAGWMRSGWRTSPRAHWCPT